MANYAYIRVSTDAQDLNNQRHGVILYAQQHGLEPLTFFDDTAGGTKDWQKREIGRLLRDVAQKGDVILTAEFSRLGRSTLQVMLILEEAAKRGVTIHIVKNGLVMDGSLNARMMALAFGMAAEIEREFISRRTTEALARRKAEGKRLGRPPGAVSAEKKLDKHKDTILDLLGKGVQKTAIAKIVDSTPDTLYRWMEENGLGAYIKSRKEKPKTGKKDDEAAGKDQKKGGDKAQALVPLKAKGKK